MAETNGQNSGGERLDRIEQVLEIIVGVQKEFAVEHKQLLTAQVVLTGHMDELAQAQKDTEGRIGILIKMMDDWIRRNPAPPA